ncbi:hypothetical protein MAM1_0068c04047 [Mucor ambiguus]|uniref:C3H1-type domain-containing protein n=1 Tax=Mucor ambiguus TaxID=91626 RepID=A0A0C9M535_9FUNG|nr:hypothetical protein MAM1_0068c04047 [Mucor ambiguus]
MTSIANQLRTKQAAIIGAGVVIVITAFTIWSWKSSSSSTNPPNKKDGKASDERSVKNKKDIKEESVANKVNDMVTKQSQIKTDAIDEASIIIKEEVVVSVQKVVDTPVEEKNEELEQKEEKVASTITETVTEIIDNHGDEISSVKSHTLSVATSSADETDICTPEHEANTVTDVKHHESTTTDQVDTQHNASYLSEDKNQDIAEKVKFDWTEESVKAALPPMNRDIVTVATASLDTAESIATEAQPEESVAVRSVTVECIATEVEDEEFVTVESVVDEAQDQKLVTVECIAAKVQDEEPVTVESISTEAQDKESVATTSTEEELALSEKVQVPSSSSSASSEKSPVSLSSSLTADAPEFIPKSFQQPTKKPTKKFLTREQLIEQQRQHHMPRSKARCSHWPHCTNNNCKFFHPYRACRAGDNCLFGDRCMFVHPSDCMVNVRENNKNATASTPLSA